MRFLLPGSAEYGAVRPHRRGHVVDRPVPLLQQFLLASAHIFIKAVNIVAFIRCALQYQMNLKLGIDSETVFRHELSYRSA